MSHRPVILIVGVLIIAQILMLVSILNGDIAVLDRGIQNVQEQQRQVNAEKAALQKKFQDLKVIIATIPPWLLAGFEDPETGFVEFLDYLQGPQLADANGKVAMRGQKFRTKPIPLHETDFAFSYNFLETNTAEQFIDYLVFQRQFPLKVTEMAVKRNSSGIVSGEIAVALLIPAKLQLSEAPSSKQAEAQ